MSDTSTIPQKEQQADNAPKITEPWRVILFNDDIHSFDDVIIQVQKATACTLIEATRITLEAHNTGKAVAFSGDFAECHRVAGVLREIQLVVEIRG